MSDLKQAAQQALEAWDDPIKDLKDLCVAMNAIRTALEQQAEPVQEPYGYFRPEPFGWTDCAETAEGAIALYERPSQRKPLTDAEIGQAWSVADSEHNASASVKRRITRAIEAAHNIQEPKS